MDTELQEIIDYKKKSGNDNIYYKEIIKKKLINNSKIIQSIDNKNLDIEEPDSFLGVNIFPYYLLPNAQTTAQNYICFETSFTEVANYNNVMKSGQIIFYILCDNKNIYDKKSGIARHDLLAALITDEFNWCTDFGTQMKLISDRPYTVDNNYALRTLTFEQITPNSIIQAQTQKVINQNR